MSLLLFEEDWRDVWNGAEPTTPLGAIFTRPHITEFIMDLAGYTPGTDRLSAKRLLEPSCGDGVFLTVAIKRLLDSEKNAASCIDWEGTNLVDSIRACDVNSAFVRQARGLVTQQLKAAGCPEPRAVFFANTWVEHADFLLKNWRDKFDYVIGNPPYVRLEDVPPGVMRRYRELYPLCVERADLYVAFFEQGLHLLKPDGALSFICANRFTKNLYGHSLREHIARRFRVRYYLNLEHTQPYVSDVSAYPCITVIDRRQGEPTRAATLDCLDGENLARLLEQKDEPKSEAWSRFPQWYNDGAPWVATDHGDYLRHEELAKRHPLLEDSAESLRIGIGVATGSDEILILPALDPTIEPTCQLPLILAGDVTPQTLNWSGHYLVNPYESEGDGGFRKLSDYPGLCAYLERNRARLVKRHTAKKNPETWFRTIDRVMPLLAQEPKLLLPDIQAGGVIGLDEGRFYPHHNLYWITSKQWDLQALQALLRSSSVLNQVRAISVQMRGGSVRYQAQVLRKLRIPHVAKVTDRLMMRLKAVAGSVNQQEIDSIATEAFGL